MSVSMSGVARLEQLASNALPASLRCRRFIAVSGEKCAGYRVEAERLQQYGPVHCFVCQDTGGGFCQIAIVEQGDSAGVCTDGASFQPGGEGQHVALLFQFFERELVTASGA